MGSGCSSPLKRLGGKRSKPARRESSPFEHEDENQPRTIAGARQLANQQQQNQSVITGVKKQQFLPENEITAQSEINEDHPSTASYYTDGKNHNDETKVSDHSQPSLEPKSQLASNTTANSTAKIVVARMMGLNGTYAPHDRHLLVSPALSPAPSICYSPSLASSAAGCSTPIDLNDLNQFFKIITFGNLLDDLEIRQANEQAPQHTQQLIQDRNDLINTISVIFFTTDAHQSSSTPWQLLDEAANRQQPTNHSEVLANHIELNLRTFCDEHLFNLKFLNLSHEHLCEHFHINNLLDASMKLFEKEYKGNNQRLFIIVLSNNINNTNNGNPNETTSNNSSSKQILDKRQLPTKIEAQSMNSLLTSFASQSDTGTIDLIKRWYNQVGNIFYLNPIYLVYPKILSESKEERDSAWRSWLLDSNNLIRNIKSIQEQKDQEFAPDIRLKLISDPQIQLIVDEPALQKRTLLIRNYSLSTNNNVSSVQSPIQQHQPQQIQPQLSNQSTRNGFLNELTRSLGDSNKLTLKRPMSDEEFNKTVSDWVTENFNKFVESISENQIVNGKHVPQFVEKSLFCELTCQRLILEHNLDSVTESFVAKCQSFFTNQILPILNSMTIGSVDAQDPEVISNDQSFSTKQLSANHLVFISGPKGCGKSTLFAQTIKFTLQEFLDKAQIIYRFCGNTLDSLSSNRLLRSICEQFCQTQGENITAASYIYSARKEIMNALNKIIKSQTCLIFLDNLDAFASSSETDLDWLCEVEANPRIKIFVMLETDSDLYKKVLGSYTDATYISLDNPSISEWAQILTSKARSKRLNSAGNLYDEIKKLSDNQEMKEVNLTYSDVSDIIHLCQIRQMNNESVYPELTPRLIQINPIKNMKNVQQAVISQLQYLMTPYQLCALMVIFESSRNGLMESDIVRIMTIISQSSKSLSNSDSRFSSTLFNYLQMQLEPWFIYIQGDKSIKINIQRDLRAKAIEYYVKGMFPNLVKEVQEALLDYFSMPTRSKSSRSNILKSETNTSIEIRENMSSSERLWMATKTSEFVNLLISTDPAKAREHLLNKNQFFTQFLYGSMPEEFLEDFNKIKYPIGRKGSGSDDLQSLADFIRQSIYPLRYDGCQVYSQIYCRALELMKSGKLSKGKKLNDLLSMSTCPPIKSLLPISETSVNSFIKTRIGQDQTGVLNSSASSLIGASNVLPATIQKQLMSRQITHQYGQQGASQVQARQKIFTILDNHRHVIVIYPDKGCLSVWNIYEEKAVRTITNLDQPRDVKMIDHKRAVILCNRELRVYDLDSGAMLNKLKGVMNQKMPFFEVFGENYVVALARNRMYVNMLNLNTGELETTFKVGEDRFLNSLLVSANGGICVCGDETQKPFPLLVWNLNERRLLYDLRLDRHEFLTRMSAISDDGHFVVSVCRQLGDTDTSSQKGPSNGGSSLSTGSHKTSPNFIVIYDLNSGTLFKKWKPGLDSCAVAISLSADRPGKVINSIMDNSILIWDLATGSKRHTLIGHSAPADVIKIQNNRLFSMDSTCRDQSLRVWDIEEGCCLSVFSSDAPVNCCQMSIRGDALVCGFAAETRLSTLVMCKNETVSDVVKRNKRRKSSKSLYIFDEPPSRKSSS